MIETDPMTSSHRISFHRQKHSDMKKDKEIKTKEDETKDRLISRKEAIKKTGYIALSAATMMMLLSKPENAQAVSPAPMPMW